MKRLEYELDDKLIIDSDGYQLIMNGTNFSDLTDGEYYLYFKIKTKSNFCGETEFYTIRDEINSTIFALTRMQDEAKGFYKIQDMIEDSFLNLSVRNGQLHINGIFNGFEKDEQDSFKFRFVTDIGCLSGLTQGLKDVLTIKYY